MTVKKFLFDLGNVFFDWSPERILLPILGSEDKLRELWANPLTRRELFKTLEQHNCSKADLLKLQEMFENVGKCLKMSENV